MGTSCPAAFGEGGMETARSTGFEEDRIDTNWLDGFGDGGIDTTRPTGFGEVVMDTT